MSSGKQVNLYPKVIQQQIQAIPAIDQKEDSKIINFLSLAGEKTIALTKSIIGDFSYMPKNKYPFVKKQKILKYLKSNCLTLATQLQNSQKLKFTEYDDDFMVNNSELDSRQQLLKAKTNFEAAQESLQLLVRSKNQAKVRFLTETAYQFDQQRYSSIAWGLLFGALICSTVYRGGSTARKAAVFLTSGHLFGQLSYHYNIDRYFDAVYRIYESQALAFIIQQRRKQQTKTYGGKTTFTD